MTRAMFVVVDGPPASGKSTLAPPLAKALSLPLVSKDTVKDAFMAVIPPADVEGSRQIGRAAVAALLAVAAQSPIGAVLESNFYRSRALEDLARLPGQVIEVFCQCDERTARQRYRRRAGTRAAGHFDELRTDDELWDEEVSRPVAGGWPVIEVDTTAALDIGGVVVAVQAAVRQTAATAPRGTASPVRTSGLLRYVDAVTVRVPDVEAGLAFYRDVLGQELLWRNDAVGQVGLGTPDSATEIVLTTTFGYEPNWKVASADAAAAAFAAAGGRIISGPTDIPIGRLAVVEDPFGNLLVLLDSTKGVYRTDADGNVVGVG
jgi:predicted enzyme related to lactoylglutathione lyase/predicted kinase